MRSPWRRCLGPAETRPSAAELLEDPFFARRAGGADGRKERAGTANGGEPSGLHDERSLRAPRASVTDEGEACEVCLDRVLWVRIGFRLSRGHLDR